MEKSKLFIILGFLNCLIISMLGWIFLSILAICGQISEFKALRTLAFVWEVKEDTWFYNLGTGWFGWVLGNNIILYHDINETRKKRSFKHECEHVFQNYRWGILYYPVYIINSCYIWLFKRQLHSYLDNFFEVKARIFAGQPAFIPKEEWRQGPKDRWAWW